MSTEFVYGVHTVQALLRAEPELITEICLLSGRDDPRCRAIFEFAKLKRIMVTQHSRVDMDKLVGANVSHQGVIAKCRSFSGLNEEVLADILQQEDCKKLLLILDGVQDPHNLGACLRTANAFGVDAVIAPKDRACGLTSVVRKVACGAASMTPFIQVTNLSRTLQNLQQDGFWIIGLDSETDMQVREIDLTGPIALVMGGEGSGMRKLTRKYCDYSAKIAMSGMVESVNVSAAAAIGLYEVMRQRG